MPLPAGTWLFTRLAVACLRDAVLFASLVSLTLYATAPASFRLEDVDQIAVSKLQEVVDHTSDYGIVSIEINSLGGNAYELARLISVVEAGHDRKLLFVCTVHGLAASAAAIFFVAGCDTRRMLDSGKLLFHAARIVQRVHPLFNGVMLPPTPEELHDLDVINTVLEGFVTEFSKISIEEYRAQIHKGDWLLTAKEAKELGMADEVFTSRPLALNIYVPVT